MFLVENERVKLTASWLNALATALVAAGAFAPAAALLYGLSHLAISTESIFGIVILCLVAGLLLHVLGRIVLGRLRE